MKERSLNNHYKSRIAKRSETGETIEEYYEVQQSEEVYLRTVLKEYTSLVRILCSCVIYE